MQSLVFSHVIGPSVEEELQDKLELLAGRGVRTTPAPAPRSVKEPSKCIVQCSGLP